MNNLFMKLKVISIFVILMAVISNRTNAQQSNLLLSGTIYGNGKLLNGATVYLYLNEGNLLVKSTLTDSVGGFKLGQLKAGTYRLEAEMVGFSAYMSKLIQLNENTILADINLIKAEIVLKEVTVTAQKALVENRIDRVVVNVDAMISNAGSNVLEALEKSPGVMIDQSGNISLKGKGVTIFIDDKPTYLSGADLESYLRALPSSTVAQIELMTNPPARYDAAGNGGIINIRTKKTKARGFNAGLNLSYIQGKYARTNNSANFNYRLDKVNIFGNLSYTTTNGYNDLDINRHFEDANGNLQSSFLQNSYIRRTGESYTTKLGADYYASERATFGIGFTGLYRPSAQNSPVNSLFNNANNKLDSTVIAENSQKNSFKNAGLNLNYRQLFKKSGRELTADIDYINYNSQSNQSFNNNSYLPNGALTNTYLLTGTLPASIDIYSAKTDYAETLAGGLKMEAGLKSSYTKTDNIADYFYTIGQVTKPDYNKTNHFLYQENINAAYINASKDFKRLAIQTGLRVEQTRSNGHQLGNATKADSTFKRNYSGLFPTVYVQYKLDTVSKHVLSMDYGRRIDRPYYQDLNPFVSPLDKFTYYTGNPFLRPSYTNSVQLSHTYNNKITTTLTYSKTLGQVNETIEIVAGNYYSRPGNIGKVTFKAISVDGSFDFFSWLNFHCFGQVANIHTISDFYTGPLDTKGTFFYIQPMLQFKPGADWAIQLDGYYQSKVTNVQFIAGEQKRVNAAVSKKLSASTTVKLVMNDIFHAYENKGTINNLALTRANYHNTSDTRTAAISLSYRFGKNVDSQRKHNANGAESEQNRVKN